MKTLITIAVLIASSASFSQDAPTIEQVRKTINRTSIKHKEVVLAQVMIETGWLKCTNCSMTNDNNLFGFCVREGKYINFKTWKDSIWYYELWQKQRYDGTSDYYDFLRQSGWKGSASMEAYITMLKEVQEILKTK
jgi:hypothetical protein